MNDTELKEKLENIRHAAIRAHLEIDDIPLISTFFRTKNLNIIRANLTKLSQDMLEIEDAFDENIKIPKDINSSIMRAAQLSILFSIRSTTNEAINSAKASISQIYNSINFYRSLLIALIALVVSIVGVVKNVI